MGQKKYTVNSALFRFGNWDGPCVHYLRAARPGFWEIRISGQDGVLLASISAVDPVRITHAAAWALYQRWARNGQLSIDHPDDRQKGDKDISAMRVGRDGKIK